MRRFLICGEFMKTYIIESYKTGKTYTIKANNINELKEKMIEKCNKEVYIVKDDTGKSYKPIHLNHYSRPMIPKEDYDNLYFYVTERGQKSINNGTKPQNVSSPRRYNTIEDVRKSALTKSYANYKVYQELINGRFPQLANTVDSVILYIYKGSKVLGTVYCAPLAKPPYKGTGVYVEYARKGGMLIVGKEYRLMKDGTISKM